MSSGHRHRHTLAPRQLDELLDRALGDKRIKAALARPYKLDTRHEIPLLGSSNVGWTRVYLDRGLRVDDAPYGTLIVDGRRLNVVPGLIRHERLEPILENVYGWTYDEAHAVAQHWEERLYQQRGFDPKAVEKSFAPLIRKDEKKRLADVPTDLDLRPMLNEPRLLHRTKAAQDKQKLPHEKVDYVDKAPGKKRCSGCVMFIKSQYGGPGCTLVRDPIMPEGVCKRYAAGALDKGKAT